MRVNNPISERTESLDRRRYSSEDPPEDFLLLLAWSAVPSENALRSGAGGMSGVRLLLHPSGRCGQASGSLPAPMKARRVK